MKHNLSRVENPTLARALDDVLLFIPQAKLQEHVNEKHDVDGAIHQEENVRVTLVGRHRRQEPDLEGCDEGGEYEGERRYEVPIADAPAGPRVYDPWHSCRSVRVGLLLVVHVQ